MAPEDKVNTDYNLSESELREVLLEFGVRRNEINGTMIDVLQLVLSSDFYDESTLRYDDLPSYAFQPTNIAEVGGYRENTRESIRKEALKPLRDNDVLGYNEPVPNSPKTHYYVSQEFREFLQESAPNEVSRELGKDA